ncbi:hypothetical protein O3P69_003232 [Scylla paramamosain]|uniref:Uncharacterized protein n=1 Tax=Scylla paramamosain TaxID=85552 RepID=A0AAW0UJV5_SCYPA
MSSAGVRSRRCHALRYASAGGGRGTALLAHRLPCSASNLPKQNGRSPRQVLCHCIAPRRCSVIRPRRSRDSAS